MGGWALYLGTHPPKNIPKYPLERDIRGRKPPLVSVANRFPPCLRIG